MLGINPKKEKLHKQTVSPLVVGAAGMIAGAAAITAIALSDEDIRKKTFKRAKETKKKLQSWSEDKLHEYKDKIKTSEVKGEEIAKELQKKIKEGKQSTEEINN